MGRRDSLRVGAAPQPRPRAATGWFAVPPTVDDPNCDGNRRKNPSHCHRNGMTLVHWGDSPAMACEGPRSSASPFGAPFVAYCTSRRISSCSSTVSKVPVPAGICISGLASLVEQPDAG